MSGKILVTEDDLFLRDGLCAFLQREGYTVTCAACRRDAERFLAENTFDLLILDIMLPDGNGVDLCIALRAAGVSVPILLLSAMDDELQIVRGLDSGADDYVTKPFKLLELHSRIKALLRRRCSEPTVFVVGDLTVDTEKMSVTKHGSAVFVTRTEFQILAKLLRNRGVIVTREGLLSSIWDAGGSFIDDNTLSVHVSRLREKIGAQHVVTVRGFGYRWQD